MARLPQPGSDQGTWGAILNDFLLRSHNSDGSLKDASVAAAQIVDGSLIETKLSSAVQLKLNTTAPVTQTAIDLKAPLADPTFTGTVTVPAPTNPTDATTKAYVDSAAAAGTPDATNLVKGKLQLTGDLGGTAASPTVPGLAAKEPTITATTSADFYRGDKTFQPLNKAAVGLADVDNTSDVDKPVSSAQQTALDLKANIASPTFTGTVTIPTGASITAPTGLVKGDVGLGNVDNTSDADKPVSTAQQIAIAATAPNMQIFTADGTWDKPVGSVFIIVIVVGGGNGGGSGRRGAAGTVRCGGGGGTGGTVSRIQLPASIIDDQVTVTVGVGGAGGAAVTTDDTDGNDGTTGGKSSFGAYCAAGNYSATQGNGKKGTNATGTGGSAIAGNFSGAAGGSASTTGLVGAVGGSGATYGGGGGGAGGGITAADAVSGGGTGGYASYGYSVVQGAYPGAAGAAGADGGAAQNRPTNSGLAPAGGGGGGSSKTADAGAGADGSLYGGAGGGGGASLNGYNSGKGGDGADGFVMVISQ